MSATTALAAKPAASSDAAVSHGKSDTGGGFAAMIAGAAKVGEHDGAAPHVVRGGDKQPHAKRDDDTTRDDDDPAAAVGGAVSAVLPPPTGTSGAADTASAKPAASSADDDKHAATVAAASAPTKDTADVDLTQVVVDTTDPQLAPVLAALADTLAAKQASDPPVAPVPIAPTAVAIAAATMPSTATAALMASRPAIKGTPFSGSADARSARNLADDGDADPDASDPTGAIDTTLSVMATPIAVSATGAAPTAHAPVVPGAAGQLATGAADRQLDLAKQGAWLDGLSHDIASTAAGTGPLRFEVAPQHLGAVQVEMTRDVAGATVTLTASSEAGRAALADARPQLIAEARAQGIHIANAQVDVGSGQTGSDSRPSSHSPSGQGGFSAQSNAQGDSQRQSQTRSQPLAANPVSIPGAPDADAAPEPTDGLYA